MPCLRIKIPGQPDETHIVCEERVTIGRRPENTIQILDRSVSAFHAELIAVHGHYRLRDLDSTNHCFVQDQPVSQYHLRERCKIAFGSVECDYDPEGEKPHIQLTPAQLEQDLAFLRAENSDLRKCIGALERQIGILGSAQLLSERISGRPASSGAAPDRTAELEEEVEQLREELAIALRARDAARAAAGMLHTEKTSILREIRSSGLHRAALPQ